MRETVALAISESSQIGEARRQATTMARHLGFDETERGKVALVVTEVATNLVRHTPGGELILRTLPAASPRGIEVLALDKGPGMANVEECLRDGFSSAGTSGNGLGAIRRLATSFDIYSVPGSGTAVLAQLCPGDRARTPLRSPSAPDSEIPGSSGDPAPRPPAQPARLQIGAVCLPIAREDVSGDAWGVRVGTGRVLVMLADGLGHGSAAAEASQAAVRVLETSKHDEPVALLEAMHAALRSTRGAAVAVAVVDLVKRVIHYAGIGNISGETLYGTASQSMVSHNGTIGHSVRKVQAFSYAWPKGALLVLHSDGLRTQWRLDRYPRLAQRDPSLIAGVLYRDFARGRDDVTVLVARDVDVARAGHSSQTAVEREGSS